MHWGERILTHDNHTLAARLDRCQHVIVGRKSHCHNHLRRSFIRQRWLGVCNLVQTLAIDKGTPGGDRDEVETHIAADIEDEGKTKELRKINSS